MKTILVVNGENYWQDFLPDYKVEQKKLQDTEWLLKNNELYALDKHSVVKPDAILWRVGAIKPLEKHRNALEMIKISGMPCVNSAKTLLQGFDRLSMLAGLRACQLPTIPFQIATNPSQLKNIQIPFPFVVKVGNYHGGWGKVLIENEAKWQDIKDLLFVSEEYVSIEPYINYSQDIRYLAIGDKVWAMARKGKFWKANVETTDFLIIEPAVELIAQTQKLKNYLKADIVAIDILEEENGTRYFVEYNDIPGLSGFSDELKFELANCIQKKVL
jgi:ribosomal protein S6--L-glutamate ligase